jgi:hypothetical protein
MIAWVTANAETIALSWGAIVALAELAKRLIPGTKDDTIIVKVLDIVAKVLTLGGVKLLPNQDGVKK